MSDSDTANYPQPDNPPRTGDEKRVLVFLNEVAGGRKLLGACREMASAGADYFGLIAPQNEPEVGQMVDPDQARDSAQSRVDVTSQVLGEFGIASVGGVMDPDPPLALDDAIRATDPDRILLSCLYETRFGPLRRDFVDWARSRYEIPIEHIPVRVDDDGVNWDITHTLVVATKTINSQELVSRLLERAEKSPHRYTFIAPRSGEVSREEICENLARTLSAMYDKEIDATGQPMSPDPLTAIRNANAHYRLDDILISTLKGEKSEWIEQGLVQEAEKLTGKPVEHVESSGRRARVPATRAAALAAVGTDTETEEGEA